MTRKQVLPNVISLSFPQWGSLLPSRGCQTWSSLLLALIADPRSGSYQHEHAPPAPGAHNVVRTVVCNYYEAELNVSTDS